MAYAVISGSSGAVWLPAILAVFEVWSFVDTVADFRHGRRNHAGRSDELSSAEVMLLMNHGHLVANALEEGPRTVDELTAECDLTESRVRDALDQMERSGVVSHNSDQYVLHEENVGPVAFVRNTITGAFRRLGRPFRV